MDVATVTSSSGLQDPVFEAEYFSHLHPSYVKPDQSIGWT